MSAAPVILVVDDESDTRENLRDLLELEGYVVRLASNGREALDHVDALGRQPCLVLLDLFMPVMNGWQFVDALRADGRLASLKILITTSAAQDAPEGFQVLRKPLDADKLLATIKRHT